MKKNNLNNTDKDNKITELDNTDKNYIHLMLVIVNGI